MTMHIGGARTEFREDAKRARNHRGDLDRQPRGRKNLPGYVHRLCSFRIQFKSLWVVFPAACREFVIPAKAGIQKTGLDSVSSTE